MSGFSFFMLNFLNEMLFISDDLKNVLLLTFIE